MSTDPQLSRSRTYFLLAAAADEATRAGHGTVDTDHVLLALLVTGGASTTLLSDAGLDLGTARAALATVQQQDLAALGVTATLLPPTNGQAAAAWDAVLPWAERARRAVGALPPGAPDTPVLTTVLADEHGPAHRLLQQAGVDAAAVRAAASAAATTPIRPATAPDAAPWTAAHSHTVAVPRGAVWAVVSDPRRRPEWDHGVLRVRVLDDRSFTALDAAARAVSRTGPGTDDPGLTSTHELVTVVEGHLLEEEVRHPNRGHTEWFSIELADDGAGTRLTLRHRAGPRRGLLRLTARLARATARNRLRLLAQSIAQATTSEDSTPEATPPA